MGAQGPVTCRPGTKCPRAACNTRDCRLRGHPDEATTLLADPDYQLTPAGFAEGFEAFETEMAIQRADEAAMAEIREAINLAKERLGASVGIRVTRMLTIDSNTGGSCGYTASLIHGTDVTVGEGSSPAIAVTRLVDQIEARRITTVLGGYGVRGVCTIAAAPYRSRADALAFARRVSVDVAYLDTLLA